MTFLILSLLLVVLGSRVVLLSVSADVSDRGAFVTVAVSASVVVVAGSSGTVVVLKISLRPVVLGSKVVLITSSTTVLLLSESFV